MSVEEKNKIDIITSNKQGILVLTISDHLEWGSNNDHLVILQEKINSYLDFIESGQIAESYRDVIGEKIMIQIVFKYQPNKIAEEFLAIVKRFINEKSYGFNFYQLESNFN